MRIGLWQMQEAKMKLSDLIRRSKKPFQIITAKAVLFWLFSKNYLILCEL